MAGAIFTRCELIRPNFQKVDNLQYATLSESKICNSEKCVEVNGFDNFLLIIDNLKLKN